MALERLQRTLGQLGLEPPACRSVLLVDDEPANLLVLQATLEEEWTVHTADCAEDALAIFEAGETIDLIISDQRMPGTQGTDLLAIVGDRWPETIRLVLTAYSDVEPIVEAINRGDVYRFLLKPWESDVLRATVRDGLELKETRTALTTVVEALAERRHSLQSRTWSSPTSNSSPRSGGAPSGRSRPGSPMTSGTSSTRS